jgi:hypothetical protein
MPIVNTIIQPSSNADGSQNVVVRNYDQDGREYMYSFYAPAGFDIQTAVNNKTADLNVQLADSEFETLIGAA